MYDFQNNMIAPIPFSVDQTEMGVVRDSVVDCLVRALALRDVETEEHTRRVTGLALNLACAFGVSESELTRIRYGAMLHDIGKIGIPDTILHKREPLSEREAEIMRRHPIYAYELLHPMPCFRSSLDIPYGHHEKWDGTGYPRGLIGEQIPFSARLFAVVDVWDALLSDRPYRPAWPLARAIEYLYEQSSRHFDTEIVTVFLENMGLQFVEETQKSTRL